MTDKPIKYFRRSEITKNNDTSSTQIIIHNNVYDVTEFLNEVSSIYVICYVISKNYIHTFFISKQLVSYNLFFSIIPNFTCKFAPSIIGYSLNFQFRLLCIKSMSGEVNLFFKSLV